MKHNYYKLIILLLLFTNSYAKVTKKTFVSIPSKIVVTKKSISFLNNTFFSSDSLKRLNEVTISKNYLIVGDDKGNINKAKAVMKKIDSLGAFIKNIEPSSFSMLPIGINKTIGNNNYTLGISNVSFKPNYTEFTAFVRIKIQQTDTTGRQKELFFGANNIKLSHKGGLVGSSNLVLLGDFPILMPGGKSTLVLKGGMDMNTGTITNKTYVTIDCGGFKELGIDADLIFSRELLVPVNANNEASTDTKELVKGSFKTVVSNWNDVLVDINLPKFQLADQKNVFTFEVNTAVFDFSDLRNSPNVLWPKDYQKDYLVPGNENLWRGVFVKSLKIVLPEQFKFKSSEGRISFEATNLLIDRVGVSGNFSADNILSIDKGSASGWAFSVNRIDLGFRANTIVSAGFAGGIVIPISNVNEKCPKNSVTELGYTALINPIDNEYLLKAEVKNNICFPMFKATATIEKGSYLELKVKDKKFLPKAFLNGNLAIKTQSVPAKSSSTTTEATLLDSKTPTTNLVYNDPPKEEKKEKTEEEEEEEKKAEEKETIQFKGIIFQSLQLQTVVPYITTDYFGYKNEIEEDAGSSKVSNFPITIHEIALTANDDSASLLIDLSINLMKDQFTGKTKFNIVGSFDKADGIQKWKYEYLKFEEIYVKADIGGGKFSGGITLMENDPVYGKGFKGNLKAEFKGGIIVQANAIFGKTTFRYWYVDALAEGLNIKSGAFQIKGFGGGAYYNMRKDGFSNSFTASGANYVPDEKASLGIKAMIQFANAASPKAFWGGAGFEIAFNKSGGLNRISIYGEGHVMQDFKIENPVAKIKENLKFIVEAEAKLGEELERLKNLKFSSVVKNALETLKTNNLTEVAKQVYPDEVTGKAGINAYAAIEFDFTTNTLHGTFDLYVDVAGGIVKGRASKNRAGWAVLHFAPETWYVRLGTPTDRLGLKMKIGPLEVEAGSYFMIGDDIPASPPPPDVVAEILGLHPSDLDYMRSENASTLGSGRGFAFGADISLKTGDITFLIFYANLQAGMGFDIMVKDYGTAECKGSGQIGIDGWYANGQAYAYCKGEIGIKVKLFMIRKKIPILKAGAAVLLQAKLPNPVWIRGYIGGYFEVLGGLVRGKFRMKLEFGEQCEFVNGAPLGGLKVIAEITPNEGDKDIDVFTIPQVGFNMPIGKTFTIEEENGVKSYKLKLEEYTIKKDGVPLVGTISWNDMQNLASFNSSDVLPQNSELTLSATVSFLEYANGSWKTIYQDGKIATETETRKFTTGKAPNYIPTNNIAYCYPVFDQKYFYQKETPQAYINLKQGQPYLFELAAGQTQKVFYKTTTSESKGNISYNAQEKKITFEVPNLSNEKKYEVKLMTLEQQANANENLSENYTEEKLDAETNVETKNNKLKATIKSGQGVEMLKYNFATSAYNTLQEKLVAKKPKQTLLEIIYMDVYALHSYNATTEPFDLLELIGSDKTMNVPLLKTEAVLDDAYYKNEIYPLIYDTYFNKVSLNFDRDISILGVPPTKGVDILAWYVDYLSNDTNINFLKNYLPFRYNLPLHYKMDFKDLQYKIINKYIPSNNFNGISNFDTILNADFPPIKKGNYSIKIDYVLPGGKLGSGGTFIYNYTN